MDGQSTRSATLWPGIRQYRPADRAAVYDICVRTAAAGGDARGRHSSDDLLPDIFAGPYLHLEPTLAHVVDDGGRAVCYVVGTAGFAAAYREVWIPRLIDRYPVPTGPPGTAEDEVIAWHHRPEGMVHPELAAYPAHLRIDLLPGYQGAGYGRDLIRSFCRAAAAAGAPAVHLGLDPANTRSRGFCGRLGFREVPVAGAPSTVYLGRSTGIEPGMVGEVPGL